MLKGAWIIASKDVLLTVKRCSALVQATLLGLLLVVLFSLSLSGSKADPTAAATIFWLASAFCQTIVMTALFSLEESNKARVGLLLAPIPAQAVWFGKTLAGLFLLAVVQASLLAASVIFLGQSLTGLMSAVAGIALVDIGIAGLGALLASLARGQTMRESLCSLVVFPLLVPQFLGGVRILAAAYGATPTTPWEWMGIAAAFDAIFIAAALAFFPILYGGDA